MNIGRDKPTVFIGSSSEFEEEARAIRSHLETIADVTLWREIFPLGTIAILELLKQPNRFDFGVFLFSPDDETVSREQSYLSPRDNVILEYGLFLGVLGVDRTFIVYDSSTQPKQPSDLAGVTLAIYRGHSHRDNILTRLGPAGDSIRRAISALGKRQVANPYNAISKEVTSSDNVNQSASSKPSITQHLVTPNINIINYTEQTLSESEIKLAQLKELWPQICATMTQRSPASAAILANAAPVQIINYTVVIRLISQFYIDRLMRNDRGRNALEDVINHVLLMPKGKYRINCVLTSE